MEPDSLSAESTFPPPPPLLPPPAPPPVASPSMGNAGGSAVSLWRWNDRLAFVVGGLAIFLLGIVTGRIFGPDTASDSGGVPVAAVSTASTPAVNVIATETETFVEEVNPPELIARTKPAEPIANPEGSTSTDEATTVVASASAVSAGTRQPTEQATTTTSPAVSSQTSPISLESRVPTIKPLAATQVCAPAKKFKDRKLSTALTWAESVQEAAQQAEEEQKLVFLIHVSGNFEMPGFT